MKRVLILTLALLFTLGVSLTLAASFSSPSAQSQQPLVSSFEGSNINVGTFEWEGFLGPASAIFVDGNLAYLGIGHKLVVLDISDPTNWLPLGQVRLPFSASAIFVADHYAYVAVNDNEFRLPYDGLQVIDVFNPATPTNVSFYYMPSHIEDLVIVGDYAYVASSVGPSFEEGLRVLDVSVPSAITEVQFYDLSPFQIEIKGNYMYVTGDGELSVWDISNPAMPSQISSYSSSHYFVGFALAGSYAYLRWSRCVGPGYYCNTTEGGLELVDISNQAEPLLVSDYQALRGVASVVVADNYAYLALRGSNQDLEVVDISNIEQPTQTLLLENIARDQIFDSAVKGNHLYLVAGSEGVQLVDISQPTMPILVKDFYNDEIGFQNYQELVVRDNYLYAAGEEGLQILDLSTPISLIPTGLHHNSSHRINFINDVSMAVVDDHAYLAWYHLNCGQALTCYRSQSTGLQILDISDPTTPIQVSRHTIKQTPPDLGYWGGKPFLALANNYAYVADRSALWVVDVSDPTAPIEVGSYKTPSANNNMVGTIHDIALAGDYVYLALGDDDLRVIDVSDPTNPVEVAFYDASGSVNGVTLAGEYAYVPTSEAGTLPSEGSLRVLTIADPTNPVEVASLHTPEAANGVTIADGKAVVIVGERKLQVVNIQNPTMPFEEGFVDILNTIETVAIIDDYLYIGSEGHGMFILRVFENEPYSITGQVVQPNGMPFTTVRLFNSLPRMTSTDATGFYAFTTPYSGTHTISPTLAGYSFVPPTRTVTLPPSASEQDFMIVSNPVSATIAANQNNSLTYTDTQGLPTRLDLPANTVAEATTWRVQPTVVSDHSHWLFAAHAFDLTASQNGASQPDLTFAEPLTITIHYSQVDVPRLANENQLALHWWDGTAWVDAATTCTPESSYERDVNQNMLTVSICQVGRYALFGPTHQLFLPLTLNNYPTYHLVAKHSGKCLDVEGASDANGAPVIQWDCSNLDNQRWRLVAEGDYFRIIAQHSGKCLDVQGASDALGVPVIQWDCSNLDNQLWRLVPVDNHFQIVAKHSQKCLHVEGASDQGRAPAIQWDCSGTDNQLWRLAPPTER